MTLVSTVEAEQTQSFLQLTPSLKAMEPPNKLHMLAYSSIIIEDLQDWQTMAAPNFVIHTVMAWGDFNSSCEKKTTPMVILTDTVKK